MPDAATVIPKFVAKGREKLGVPFDSAFDLSTDDRLYCTEFIRYDVNEAVGRSLINPVAIKGQAFIPLDEVYRKDFEKVYDSKAPAPAP